MGVPRAALVLPAAAWLLLSAAAGAAEEAVSFITPVDGPVTRRFEAADGLWGAGHRGVDFDALPGTRVRAAADGTVAFAERVASLLAVSIDHGDGLRSTYSSLGTVAVARGDRVTAGRYIGTVKETHPGGAAGLHFGVKKGDEYLDPEIFLGPFDASRAIRLAPLEGGQRCRDPQVPARRGPAPTSNVVVTMAGIDSTSDGPTPLDRAVRALGYPEAATYRFSYRGAGRRYGRRDTHQDLVLSAGHLEALLRDVAREHPGRGVDIVAHSQGGLIARLYLQTLAREWDPGLPQVENLVTFATPHRGSPAADLGAGLEGSTWIGPRLLDLAETAGAPPRSSPAVTQMRTGSPFVAALAREDVVMGTRVLSLAAAGDLLVPEHRALYDGGARKVVPAAGAFAHSAVTGSPVALGAAYSFLRGGPDPCFRMSDRLALWNGRSTEALQDLIPAGLRWVETGIVARLLGVRRLAAAAGRRLLEGGE